MMGCCICPHMSSSRPACRHPWGVQHSVPFFFAQLSCEEKKEIEEIENICSCFMEIEEKYIFTILVFVRFVKISPNLWEGDDKNCLQYYWITFVHFVKCDDVFGWCQLLKQLEPFFQLQLHHYYVNNFEQVSHYL